MYPRFNALNLRSEFPALECSSDQQPSVVSSSAFSSQHLSKNYLVCLLPAGFFNIVMLIVLRIFLSEIPVKSRRCNAHFHFKQSNIRPTIC